MPRAPCTAPDSGWDNAGFVSHTETRYHQWDYQKVSLWNKMLSAPTTCPKLKHKCSGGKKDNLALHAWHAADLGHCMCTHSISLSVVCEEREKKLCYFFHSHLPSEIQFLWSHIHALPNGSISISLLTLKSCIIYSTQRVQQCKVPSTNSLSAHTPSQGSAQTTCSDPRCHHKEIRSEIPIQSPHNKEVTQGRAGISF